jgi:hypothetical protein
MVARDSFRDEQKRDEYRAVVAQRQFDKRRKELNS